MTLPHWVRYYIGKKESAMSHMAWGGWLAMITHLQSGSTWAGLVAAALMGVAWEYTTYWLSERQWKPAVLDMVPWVVGGFLSWVMLVW